MNSDRFAMSNSVLEPQRREASPDPRDAPVLSFAFWRYELSPSGNLPVYLALSLFTFIAYLFGDIELTKDRMVPFKSPTFALGAGLVFYWALIHSLRQAMVLTTGMLLIMAMVRIQFEEPLNEVRLAVELPLVGLFLAGLALVPNVIPWMLDEERQALKTENDRIDTKLEPLRRELKKVHESQYKERAQQLRQEAAGLSSRMTSLNTYAREIQQAGSNREIVNLLFLHATKIFGFDEAVMVLIPSDTEVVVSRAIHPESERLENTRYGLTDETILEMMETRKAVRFDPPQRVLGEMFAIYSFPLVVDERVYAIGFVSRIRGGELNPKDGRFIEGMVNMAEGAIAQLAIALHVG